MPDVRIDKLKVAEAMKYDFGRVDQQMPVEQVINLMLQNRWDEVMVTDGDHGFMGIATKEQLVKSVSNGFSQEQPIMEICSRDIIYSHEQEYLTEARDIMRRRKIGRLPVLNSDKKVVGMLTSMDVCSGFSFKLEALGKHMYAVMENIAEAIQVIDRAGTVNVWNNSAEKLFGIKAKDIIGRNLADFFPDDIMLRVIKTLKPYNNIFCELREGVYAVRNAVPVITASGENMGAVCTTLNVSKEKTLIEKLDQVSNKVKTLECRKCKIGCSEKDDDTFFYTTNMATKRCLERAKRVGHTDAAVLIQGESGTGKELMANVIYRNSQRAQSPLIAVNCSAIPEALFESEMFGYGPGTFTGGNRLGKPGKFE
ncbi:MAG: sigma 54-interacting transcriptional regulator, partial [Deltaproteobacteria bacterium]|nr:sigma 54-interacting transcriptional regulator [Deltaproteobacteria bacterium]